MRGRSMMEGLLAWIPAMDSDRPRLWRDCLTVREASESLVTKKSGQVSLTQLNPMEAIFLEMASMGFLLRPSVTMGSRCDIQFTHASFTRSPKCLFIYLFILITIFFFSFNSKIYEKKRKEKRAKTKFFWLIKRQQVTYV